MTVVGFDVAKASVTGAAVNRQGVVQTHYTVANTPDALRELLVGLRTTHAHLLVAAEATGDYHRHLGLVCLELGITFRVLNPLTVKQFIRTTVRKRKTDLTDAEAIAKVALGGGGYLFTLADASLAKPLARTSITLMEMSQMCNLIQQRLGALMPTYGNLLTELEACQSRLKQAASTYRQAAMAYTDPATRKLLTSIPGIADNLATDLLVEIGDITRFKGPKQLVAFAGLDPKVLQSGKTLHRYGHLTRRGSPTLRRALFVAASVAKRCDPACKALYDKKRAEGKRYKEATIVVARKLLRIIFAVWVNGKPYQQMGT